VNIIAKVCFDGPRTAQEKTATSPVAFQQLDSWQWEIAGNEPGSIGQLEVKRLRLGGDRGLQT
jgi:hypothetical protein